MYKLFSTLFLLLFSVYSIAQPGKNGGLTIGSGNQILNQYMPVSANIAAGSNTVSMATTGLFTICPGDLIMIYQAQGAAMDITNTTAYGTILNYNSAGLYEFKYVQSISGSIITTQTTFTNSYATAGRVQLIKVPQYTNLTINAGASVIPKPWKDTTIAATPYRFGGLVVIHATNIINNGTIDASGRGFRGGASFNTSGLNLGFTAIRSTLSNQGGEKGESIFGYQLDYDGLSGGRYCLGAPANAGGGGNGHNAGGGGGANGNNGNTWSGQGVMVVNATNLLAAWALSSAYVANGNSLTNSSGGGHGGYSYGDANANATTQGPGNAAWVGDTRREVGGIGGRPLTNINPEIRIYFGGGGGASHSDNFATPVATNGGGIVYLITTTGITGNGVITSNGINVGNSFGCNCDGLSGAGAGGSIVIKTAAVVSTQNVSAIGGNGGNQMFPVSPSNPNESEGPGGGGGGGFTAISAGAIVSNVNGGLNGSSLSNAVANEMTFNGATQGATGQTLPVSTNFIAFIPIAPVAVSAANNGPLCAGATLVLTTTVAANSFTWTGPNAANSSSQTYSITNITSAAAGIYSLQLNFGSCSVPATATTQVTISNSPTITISNATVCSGQTINLTPTVIGATSYTWIGPNGFNANTQNISIPNALANSSGGYSLTVINTGGCTATVVANVSVITTPTPTLSSNAPLCAGSTLNFTTTGATSYTLNGPNVFSSTLPNPSINNISTAAAGSYTLLASSNGCSATALNSVIINPAPIVTINIAPSTICEGQTVNLSGSGGNSYLWIGPNLFTSTLQNPIIPSSSINNNGSYTLTVTSAGGCTAAAISQPLVVNLTPTLSITGSSVCINQPANISANTNATSFLWNGPNGFNSAAQTINFNNASFSLSGIYNVTVTSAQGCTNTAAANVSVFPVPSPTLTSNSPVCAGGTLNFTGSGGATFSYNGPNGFTSNLQNPSISNVTFAAAGVYTLTVSNFGCSATATLPITIFGSGSGTLSLSDNEKCVPFCSTFSVNTNGAPIVSASLSVNGQLYLGNSINYCITQAGTYTISSNFKDADGCLNSSSLTVTGYPKPIADFVFSPLHPVENIDEVLFTNTSTGINQISWNWFFNNNNGFTSANQNTFYMFENADSYPVAMVVKNVWGCEDTVIKVIVIEDDFSFYIPNTFTPDGDGLNETFYPKGHGIKNYTMQIFDRWGEKLFTSNDFYVGWDGTFKGQKCQIDTYVWKIELSDPKGKTRTFTGHVNIIE